MAINSMNSVSHGLSGLVSGMDTQSMVDAMLANTQAKIDKQKASKTILGYRRDTYRNSIKELKALQDSFFKFGSNSSTNLLSSTFYNTMAAANKSSAFKVTAGGNARAGKTSVNSIEQLAQSLKMKSLLTKTTAKVEGELDLSKLKHDGISGEIQLMLDGVSKTIKLPKVTLADPANATAAEKQAFVDQLNVAIKHEFGSGVKAELSGSKISFVPSDSSREFKVMGHADAMGVLGFKTGTSNKINTAMYIKDINFAEPLMGDSFKFKINGVEIAVSADETLDTVISKINTSNANVKVRYSAIEDKFSIESTVSGVGSTITMSQSEGNLLSAMFGIGSGGGIGGPTMYSYSGGLTGKVPGVNDTVTDQAAIDALIGSMNSNIDTFMGENKGSFKIRVDGKEYELKSSTPISGDKYTIEDVIKAIDDNAELSDKGVKLSLDITNGQFTGGVTLSAKEGVKVEAGQGMSLMGISGHNEKLATKDSTLAQMGITGPLNINVGNTNLNFTDMANTKLSDVLTAMEGELEDQSIAAAEIKNGGPLTADQEKGIRDKISLEVLEAPPGSEGKIRLFGIDIPIDISITGDDKKLFGTDTIQLNTGNLPDGSPDPNKNQMELVTAGQNAVLYINGERVERNSNEFTVEGLSFELKETFNTGYSSETVHDTTKYADIDITRDTDQIFNGIVKFMDEYNKLVDKTWGLLKEDANYKDFPPLTDKQKEGMSEKEIELWEKKSQEGLMRGDDALEAIMDSMRQVLSYKPAGSKYSLADMGITTGYDMESGIGGKLIFNDKNGNGEKLRDIIAQEPETLEKLFTDSSNGIMVELNKVLEGATTGAKTSNNYSKLSLVELAGSSSADTSSRMYKEGKEIDKNLENLKRKYEAEYARYWKQFNAMEQMIQQMNQQSSWLTQQLGG